MKIKYEPVTPAKAKTEGGDPVVVVKPAQQTSTPWSVEVKREKGVVTAKAEAADDILPWKVSVTKATPQNTPKIREKGLTPARVQRACVQAAHEPDETPAEASWEQDGPATPQGDRLVCIKNYSAVEAIKGGYGLIDRGSQEVGLQTLIMHTPRGKRKAYGLPDTEEVRPGSILKVNSTRKGGKGGLLRVRFVTPARYYTPGSRITTTCIGVDASDWLDLMPQRRRI